MAANVVVQVSGGSKQVLDGVSTVGDVKQRLGLSGYTAMVNGNPTQDCTQLQDGNYVTLAQPIKGGV